MALDIETRDQAVGEDGLPVEELVVNIGPSHPSTHGVGRFVVHLDGETVTKVDPVIGYLHRGIEKMAENRTYLQVVPLTDRLDYVGSMYANWAPRAGSTTPSPSPRRTATSSPRWTSCSSAI